MHWHHGPKIDGETSVVINGESLYRYHFDLNKHDRVRAFFDRVSGPVVDLDTLEDVGGEIAAYEYHPSMATNYRKAG